MIGINGIAPESLAEASSLWLIVLLDAALKGLIVLLVAAVATRLMQKASAATRHLVWLFAALSLLVLPVLSLTLPQWNVLPSWMGWPSRHAPTPVAQADPSPDPADDLEVADSGMPTHWDGPSESESLSVADASAVFTPATQHAGSPSPQEHEATVPKGHSTSAVAESLPEATVAVAQIAPGSAFPWQACVLMAWVAGSLVAILPIVLGGLSLWWLKRTAVVASDGQLTTALPEVVTELGIRRKVALLLSDRRLVPMQWGTWRPILLLPESAREWSSDRLRAVLLHELAHVRRNDCLVRMLVHLLCAIYWFNPLMWIARRCLQVESEAACDDLVIRAGYEPRDYAQHLLEVVAGLHKTRLAGAAAMAMASHTRLETRMLAILDRSRNRRSVTRMVAGAVLVCLLGLTVPLAMLHEASVGASAEASEEASVAADSKARREKAEKFIHLLKERKFREAVGLFDSTLFPALPYTELVRIWDEFEKRCGSFREAISYTERDFSGETLTEARCQWEKAVMLIRLAFDGENRISGFWLARDREGPTPEGFRRGGYAFGAKVKPLAEKEASGGKKREEGKLAIDVRISGVDGNPIDQRSAVTIWERVNASDVEPRDRTSNDPRDGTIWRRVSGSLAGQTSPARNGKDRFLSRSNLRPGVYRVTAFVGSRKEKMLGMAVSEPIRLDGSQTTTLVPISIQEGPTATFTILDSETEAPIAYPTPGIRLTRNDGFDVEWNPLNSNLFPGDDGKYRIEHLTPASYEVDVSARAYAYGYPEYRLEEPVTIEVRDGEANDFVFKLPPIPLDEAEAQKRWPWAVEGVVTVHGQPLEGVKIRAACGMGTLRSTMPVTSDSDGRYLLRFGPGMMIKNEETGEWGAGVQVASIFASKDGYAEENLGRQGGLLMADEMPEDESRWDKKRIILPGKPYRLDFTMVPRATIKGQLVDEDGNPLPETRIYLDGDKLPPSSSVYRVTTTDAEGRFQFDDIASGFAWWFELSDSKDFALPRTQPTTLREGGDYQVELRVTSHEDVGKMLRIANVHDSHGQDVSDQVLGDDPRARPFVDDETAAKAREILDRVAEANRYWFRSPSDDIDSFSYTFHLAGKEQRKITYEDYRNARSWHREWYPKGISYTGGARVLTSLRTRAKFREVQIGDQQISLYFVLKGLPSKVAAGNGISRSWHGFSSTTMHEGRFIFDAKRLTPISIEYGGTSERYSDYVEVRPSCYVPLSIQIGKPGSEYRWSFRVYKPGLWLFHQSYLQGGDSDEPVASLKNVEVNGKAAELMLAPDKTTATGDDVGQILAQLVKGDSADKQRNPHDTAVPWGEAVGGLQMRLTKAGDEKSANIPLVLELRNTSDAPVWLERLWDVYLVEATDTAGGRVHLANRLDPPGPWTTRKTDIQPGETIRWTDWCGRFRGAKPPDGNGRVRIRFFLPLRRARADEPDLSVYTNWLTLPMLDPRQIAGEADLPNGWSGVQSFVCVHNPGGLSPPRRLHVDGQGRARLVRPPWGYEDKVVPFGRYETRLERKDLDHLLGLLREQKIWEVDKPILPSVSDDGELGFALIVDKTGLVRSFPGMFVEKRPPLRALQSEMERLMAKVVEQATKEGTAFPVGATGPNSRLLAQAWARLVAESTDKVTGGMRGVDVDLAARELRETYPTVLFATAEEQRQFSRRQFPDAENAELFSACAEKLEQQSTLPEIAPFLIRKFRAGELKRDELEVARRFLEAVAGEADVE